MEKGQYYLKLFAGCISPHSKSISLSAFSLGFQTVLLTCSKVIQVLLQTPPTKNFSKTLLLQVWSTDKENHRLHPGLLNQNLLFQTKPPSDYFLFIISLQLLILSYSLETMAVGFPIFSKQAAGLKEKKTASHKIIPPHSAQQQAQEESHTTFWSLDSQLL